MINHGLSTGALFLLIGMVYERYHTRDMAQLGGLAAKMPVWATFMVFFVMASVGLPGLNGFISEFMCLLVRSSPSDGWAGGTWGLVAAVADRMPVLTPGLLGPWYAAIAGRWDDHRRDVPAPAHRQGRLGTAGGTRRSRWTLRPRWGSFPRSGERSRT